MVHSGPSASPLREKEHISLSLAGDMQSGPAIARNARADAMRSRLEGSHAAFFPDFHAWRPARSLSRTMSRTSKIERCRDDRAEQAHPQLDQREILEPAARHRRDPLAGRTKCSGNTRRVARR